MNPDNKIPLKELISYFGYGMGQCFSFGLVGSFILYFYTDVMGISPVTASMIFLIARVWDAVHDPLIAGVMDTLNLRGGKYRPFLLFTPFLIFLATVASFWNIDISIAHKAIYAGITYVLWGTLYALSDIPFWSMTSVMTDNPQERTKAATCAMLGVNAGIGGALLLFPLISSRLAGYSNDKGYLAGVALLMIVGVGLMLNGFFNMKERVKSHTQEKITLKQTFVSVWKNKPLFFVLAAFFMILCTLEVIARVVFWFIGYQSVITVLVCFTIITAIFMMTNPLISAMIADTVEYSWYHTGKRCAAITFSGQTFTGKLSVAIAGAASGLILALIGYQSNVVQTAETLNGLFLCVSLLPAVGAVIRIVIMSKYTFTEEKHAEICEKLKRGEFHHSVLISKK
ncbi:MFS transporter [Escherichia coli]